MSIVSGLAPSSFRKAATDVNGTRAETRHNEAIAFASIYVDTDAVLLAIGTVNT